MKIALDGGALCTSADKKFGNYIFTKNFIDAVSRFDKKNKYFIYSFCQKPGWLKTNNRINYRLLKPKYLWLSSRVSIEELSSNNKIYLALNQAIPIFVKGKIISFSHGLSFHFFSDYYPDSYYALEDQIRPMVNRSTNVVVSSIKVKKELSKLFPDYKGFVVINYGVPLDILPYNKRKRKKFFLYVGMNHPIKNIQFLIRVFNKIRKDNKFKDYKLFLVGNLSSYQDVSNNIFAIERIERSKLREFYANATAYLSSSYYESFNFPILEALSKECPVVALKSAIIPELKKYVFQAANFDEFVNTVKRVSITVKKQVNYLQIRRQFSWKKYIAKLLSLYD